VADLDRTVTLELSDRWLWIVDDQLVHGPISADALNLNDEKRVVEMPALARALALNTEGKTVKALEEVEAAVEADPKSPELQWAKGQLEFELARYDNALKSYEELLDLRPGDKAVVFNQAVCLERLARYEDAADRFRRVIKVDAAFAPAHLGLAVSLLNLGRPADAIEEYDTFLHTNPDHDRALLGKATALQLLSQLDDAWAIYRVLVRRMPGDVDLLTNIIAIAIARHDEDALLEHAEALLKVKPDSRVALEALMTAALWRDDFEVAAECGQQCVKVASDSYEAHFNLALALHKTGRVQEAAQAYQQAIKLRSDGLEAYENLAVILQETGDLERARILHERVLDLNPAHTGTLWNLAVLNEREGHRDEAERYYTYLVTQKPDSNDAWSRLGCLRLEKGDYPGAIEALEKTATQANAPVETQLNLALALWRSGKPDDARNAFAKLLKEQPNSADVVRAFAALETEQGEYLTALELESKLQQLGDPVPDLAYNIGILLQNVDLHEDAVEAFRRAVSQKKNFAEALVNMGHSLKALGKELEARECWCDAVKAKPDLAAAYFAPTA